MSPTRSYLVCATPRSGSTLVCKALRDTGVAGRPEEYFEALRSTGRPRRPEQYFAGVDDPSIFDELGDPAEGQGPPPAWSRTAYDRYLEWAMEAGTTPNGVFASKLMWQYLGDFVGLLRNIPEYRELPLSDLFPTAFPDLTFVRVVRDQRSARPSRCGRPCRRPAGATTAARGHRPTRLHTRRSWTSSTSHSFVSTTTRSPICSTTSSGRGELGRLLRAHQDQADPGPLRELCGRLHDEHVSTSSSGSGSPAPGLRRTSEPRMKRQSDGINDDWAKRFSELRLGTRFDLVPTVGNAAAGASVR